MFLWAFCMWRGDLLFAAMSGLKTWALNSHAKKRREESFLHVKGETKKIRKLSCKETVSPLSMETLQTNRRLLQPAMRFTAMSVAWSALRCAVLMGHVAAQSATDDVCQTCCFSDGVKPALRKNLDGKQWKTEINWYRLGNYSIKSLSTLVSRTGKPLLYTPQLYIYPYMILWM